MSINPKSLANLKPRPRQPSGVEKKRKEVRLPIALLATLETNAKLSRMTFSDYVEKLLIQALEE